MEDESAEVTEFKRTAFERHAQTALVLLLVALLIWVGNTTQITAVSVAEMRVELAYLKAAALAPDVRYSELSKRVDDTNSRLETLEKDIINERQ